MLENNVPNQGVGQNLPNLRHKLWSSEDFGRMLAAFMADNLWREERILFLHLINIGTYML